MIIYLMRHAEAISAHEWRKADKDRPLTKRGETLTRAALPKIQSANLGVQKIFTSPYKRAADTAAIVAAAFPGLTPIPANELSSGGSSKTYKPLLIREKDSGALLLVGHMPEVAVIASHISGIAAFLEDGLAPGEIAAVEIENVDGPWGGGNLLWRKRLEDWK